MATSHFVCLSPCVHNLVFKLCIPHRKREINESDRRDDIQRWATFNFSITTPESDYHLHAFSSFPHRVYPPSYCLSLTMLDVVWRWHVGRTRYHCSDLGNRLMAVQRSGRNPLARVPPLTYSRLSPFPFGFYLLFPPLPLERPRKWHMIHTTRLLHTSLHDSDSGRSLSPQPHFIKAGPS